MGVLRHAVLASAISVLTVGAAQAADLITMPISSGVAAMPVHDANDPFDWNGFYAGVYGVGQVGSTSGTQVGLGINAGVNAQLDFFLIGGEVALHGLTSGSALDTAYGQILGRAGVVITDSVLLYAAVGYGLDVTAFAEDDLLLGGGVEVAIADELSLRAQYLHSFPLSGGNTKDQVTLGAHFHF